MRLCNSYLTKLLQYNVITMPLLGPVLYMGIMHMFVFLFVPGICKLDILSKINLCPKGKFGHKASTYGIF